MSLHMPIALDLFSNLFSLYIQLADTYIFYIRYYTAIATVSKAKKIAIHTYISVVLVLTWIPAYTVVPFLLNIDSPEFSELVVIPSMFYLCER